MDKTIIITKEQINIITNKYQEYSLPVTTKYQLFRAKIKNTSITIYTTGKLHFQGEYDSIYNEICELLNIESEEIKLDGKNIIGTDEVGTGDFFGGIFVCACFVPQDKESLLKDLGIRDSKKITDEKINELAPIIMKNFKYIVNGINNESYNKISKKRNMNEIKALLHNMAIKDLIQAAIYYDQIIIDGFCTKEKYFEYLRKNKDEIIENVNLIEKAEDKYLAVGAASIIARYKFLKHIEYISEQSGYQILKGAGENVDELIKKIIDDGNKEILSKIAKLNFKNYTKLK